MSEQEKFIERYERAFSKEGLSDVKFFVKDGHNMTVEEFRADANRFDAAAAKAQPVSLADLDAKFRAR